MIAEAGWAATQTEYVALAWVLSKRARASGRGLVWTVEHYCSAFGGEPRKRRQQWLRELPSNGVAKPEAWPRNASWERYAPHWQRVLELVDEWADGEHPDPCPNALHWGGPNDEPQGRMREVCEELPAGNTFYGVM